MKTRGISAEASPAKVVGNGVGSAVVGFHDGVEVGCAVVGFDDGVEVGSNVVDGLEEGFDDGPADKVGFEDGLKRKHER